MWGGGGLRGRLPALSGPTRIGKGPPLACSITARVPSSEFTMICARVWCPVQYTALRSRSTNSVGIATVTRCLEGRVGDGSSFSIPAFWVLLVDETISVGMRVVAFPVPVSGGNRPQPQCGSMKPVGIRQAKREASLVYDHVGVGLHQQWQTSMPKPVQGSRPAALQESTLESSGHPSLHVHENGS